MKAQSPVGSRMPLVCHLLLCHGICPVCPSLKPWNREEKQEKGVFQIICGIRGLVEPPQSRDSARGRAHVLCPSLLMSWECHSWPSLPAAPQYFTSESLKGVFPDGSTLFCFPPVSFSSPRESFLPTEGRVCPSCTRSLVVRGGRNRDEGKDGSSEGKESQAAEPEQSQRHFCSLRRDELAIWGMTKSPQLCQTNTNPHHSPHCHPTPASHTKWGRFLGNASGEEKKELILISIRAGLCPKCPRVALSIPSPVVGRSQHRLCLPSLLPSVRQLPAAGNRPGICWGEKGFFGQLQPGQILQGSPSLASAFPSPAQPRT